MILLYDRTKNQYWTFDNDAKLLGSKLGLHPYKNDKGLSLTATQFNLKAYTLNEIKGESGAFTLCELKKIPVPHIKHSLQSVILKAELLDDKGAAQTITIVNNHKEQNSDAGIYWADRGFAKSLLGAVAFGHPSFRFDNALYKFLSIELTEKYKYFLKRRMHFLNINARPETVYICNLLESIAGETLPALVFCSDFEEPIEISLLYSAHDDKYFVERTAYNAIVKKYGLPYIALSPGPDIPVSTDPVLAEESLLHLYGYNVSEEKGLSDQFRQALLARLLDYRLFTKQAIFDHYYVLKLMHEEDPKWKDALAKWQRDCSFVNNTYQFEDWRKKWRNSFKRIMNTVGTI